MQSDYFELFDLGDDYTINNQRLDQQYQRLQQQVHPDRFTHQSPQERRLAMQFSAQVNDAYQTLKDPLKRALYLLKKKGVTIEQAKLSQAFLLEQFEWQEKIEILNNTNEVERAAFLKKIDEKLDLAEQQLALAFSENNVDLAQEWVQKIPFFRQLKERIRLL